MASRDKKFVLDQGEGTIDIISNIELARQVKAGEMSIEIALMMAHDAGVLKLENACRTKSRKMCTISPDHTYYRAVGTRVIKECAEEIIKERK